jgi:1-acyl-sn-glycerol-3-phosphate acyltransferase
MIFPEAGRTLDGTVGPFRPGAFRLAASLGVPVLPVTISGGHQAWPPGRVLPRRGRITIRYHALDRPDSSLEPRAAARELADRVRATIVSALGADAGRRVPGSARH